MRSLSKRPRVVIVTDAWAPQVNGVVRTLVNTRAQLHARGVHVDLITPQQFVTLPCPGYNEIRLSLVRSKAIEAMIDDLGPDALHIATEGPIGWAARSAALRRGWAFTTAYHTRFPEYIHARTGLPQSILYRLLRRFHAPSSAVLVPTPSMIFDLQGHGFSNTTLWGRGVDHNIFFPRLRQQAPNPTGPVFLYAGRLSAEKNIEAFLRLDLPGEKWVAGGGPMEGSLKRRYRDVRWIGVLSQHELASIYSKADVFVFPSRTDTFGLVMLEAMACGLPVAAFPVAGPNDVVGSSGAGVLSNDLRAACLDCLSIPRDRPIAHAAHHTWQSATQQFWDALVPIRQLNRQLTHTQPSGLAGHPNSQ
jgi:glycosyltransferase involved in cell wall biosynthesis